MARTIGRSRGADTWEPRFRDTWIDLLSRAGEAVSGADAEGIRQICGDLEAVGAGLFEGGAGRPVHGALLVNLRNILEAMDAVAAAQPVRAYSRAETLATAGR